jgi:nucleotide-binding universal stress UspA family protein
MPFRADLLVIGTRGAGRFSGVRIGGVAMKVLHQASLPVVLVPPATAP